jgi:hypothetical protein
MSAPYPQDERVARDDDAAHLDAAHDRDRLTNVEAMLGPIPEPVEHDPREDDYINRLGSTIDRRTGQRHWPGGTPGGGSSGNA